MYVRGYGKCRSSARRHTAAYLPAGASPWSRNAAPNAAVSPPVARGTMSTLTRFRVRFALLLAVCAGGLALDAAPAAAQYFGRNKVQYRTFDFHVLRTTHFDVYFYPEEEQAARDAARMAERWYSRLSRVLEHEFEERQPLILYASHPHFQQTSALSGDIGEGTGGVTDALNQL